MATLMSNTLTFPAAYPLPELLVHHYSQLIITLNGRPIQDAQFNFNLPDNSTPEYPIYCLHLIDHLAPEQPPASHVLNHIFNIGASSRVTIIEHYINLSPQFNHCSASTQINQSENSSVWHYVIQEKGIKNQIKNTVQLAQQTTYHGYLLPLSVQHQVIEQTLLLQGKGAHAELSGLNYLTGHDSCELQAYIHHLASHTTSNTVLRSVCQDRTISTIGGDILVSPNTPNTHANFENKNLLLSNTAQVISRPVLEINHNQIQCTHGATCGPLDPDALFYLTSRGLSVASAKRLLITGFMDSIIQTIQIPEISELIQHKIK
jgi:Fe-S cluster assembly protein SufD